MANIPLNLRSLPRRSSEIWQLGLYPLHGMRVREGGEIVEPIACLILDVRSRYAVSVQLGIPGTPAHELALEALAAGARKQDVRHVPGSIQVRDPELAALIRPVLQGERIAVELADQLPELDELFAEMSQDMLPPPTPGWLEAPGMTLPRLAGYAEAAAMLFKAAPWQHLADADLIQIESPAAPSAELRFASLMGAAGETFGIAFFPNRRRFEGMVGSGDPTTMHHEGGTALIFNSEEYLPPGDAELWLQERLPLAAEDAHPLLLRYPARAGYERLDGAAVTFIEGLCRALAQTSEAQIDSGRWEHCVQTADGNATYVLSIPSLIDAMEGIKPKFNPATMDMRVRDADMLAIGMLMSERQPESIDDMNRIMARELMGKAPQLPPPTTPYEQAQWKCFEAFEHRGRRRIQLANEALSISPDVADAYCILAEQRTFDPQGALDLFRQGVEAGRRALGEAPFNDPAYPFWGDVHSRPYMRARQGLAHTLDSLGRKAEAVEEYGELLRLNPRDNQGIRYLLAPLLLGLNQLDELDELLNSDDYVMDDSAEWAYVQALLAFRRSSASPEARTMMIEAIRNNPHVPKYLLGRAPLPPREPAYYQQGGEDEAVLVATALRALWEETPKALDWLGKCKRQLNQRAGERKRRRKRR